jgi:hypothetical protein
VNTLPYSYVTPSDSCSDSWTGLVINTLPSSYIGNQIPITLSHSYLAS